MRSAKSIDELYEEVKDHDLVITNDAALATALNGRISVPRIGGFAYTPRHIAGNEAVPIFGKGLLGDLEIISKIADETDHSFKHIHSELENIRTIRKYTKDVGKYLYSRSSKEIYSSFLALPTVEKLMDSYVPDEREFFQGKKTAVIGIELFDDLDKHFIPTVHDEIDIFKDGKYDIDVIYEVGNDRQIADNIVGLIEEETSCDTAIVLDTAGPIADAVRAALYRKNISFRNTVTVKDLSQVRDYLQFLSLSLSFDVLRVRHVRELLSGYHGSFNKQLDEYFVHKIRDHLDDRTKELTDAMEKIRSMTFLEVCDIAVSSTHRPQIKILIEDMGLKDLKITSKRVNELAYAVNNIDDLHHNEEIPDSEKKGVLLADCLQSVYVDRPFVIYLGLGPEWSKNIIGKNYIDRETEAELDVQRFTVLLQQGDSRLYAVNSMRNGKESSPSPLFEEIQQQENAAGVSSFEDVSISLVKGRWSTPQCKDVSFIGRSVTGPVEKTDWKFSKSTYNSYYACPRAYMYGKIISIPDSEQTIFGNIMHEFAEFYLCYPNLVAGKIEEYTEFIEERYSGLASRQMKDIDRSKIRVCMINIIRFIDSLNAKDVPLDMDYSLRKRGNSFMDMHNCERYSSITEATFISHSHPLSGNFDLIYDGRIIDYKTGSSAKASDIKNRMDTSKEQDYYEFQPLIYLSLLNDRAPPPHRFSLVYAADNDVRSVTDSDFTIAENVRDVYLIKEDMSAFLSDENSCVKSLFGKTYSDYISNWRSFISVLTDFGIDKYPFWKTNDVLISSVLSAVGLKDGGTNRSNAAIALNKIAGVVASGFFAEDKEVIVPSDTLERFLAGVDEDHTVASEQYYSDFPAAPRRNCRNCDFFKACTRDITDLEGDEANE